MNAPNVSPRVQPGADNGAGHDYHPAWWIPGAHARTLWGKIVTRRTLAPTRLERWDTPDGDFLELLRLDAPAGRPRLVILHGLEGSPRSHYAVGLLDQAWRRGWAADVIIFRSCGTEPNRLPRFYHSGETGDLDFVLERLARAEPARAVGLAGVSLGGNVLLKWLGERGPHLLATVRGAVAISVPFDLARGSRHIDHGFSRFYQSYFLRSLKRKARAKAAIYPDRLRRDLIDRSRTLYEFDDLVTAPLHGFRDAADYYARSSALGYLEGIRAPTLLLSARDDPFLPVDVLDQVQRLAANSPWLTTEFPARGGHVGFIAGRVPWRPFYYASWRAAEFLTGLL